MSQQVKVYRKLEMGNSTSPVTLTVESSNRPVFESYITCASTSASVSAESLYMKTTMTGTAGVGGRARFHLYTNVALGGWANALKSYTEFGSAGKVTGLASSMCVEMKTANASLGSGGAYYPLEIEYVAGGTATTSAGSATGNQVGFIYMNSSGDADGDFDDNGFLLRVLGLTAGAAHLFATGANTGTIAGSLKIIVNSTKYYLPLWSTAVVA